MIAFNTQHTYTVASEKVHNVQLLYTARHSMHHCIVSDIDTSVCHLIFIGNYKVLQLLPCAACKYYVTWLYLVLYYLYILSSDSVRERLIQHPHGKQTDTDLTYGIYNLGFISLVAKQQSETEQKKLAFHITSQILRLGSLF